MPQFMESWGIFLFTVKFSKVIIKRKEVRGVNYEACHLFSHGI